MAYVLIDGYIVKRAQDKAVLVVKAGGQEVWIPRSLIEQGDAADVGETDLAVQEWFVLRNSLDY